MRGNRSPIASTKKIKPGRSCQACHIRKVSCDRLAPACSACLRHARTLGQDPATLCCDYVVLAGPSSSKASRSKPWRAASRSPKRSPSPRIRDAEITTTKDTDPSHDPLLTLPEPAHYHCFTLPPLLFTPVVAAPLEDVHNSPFHPFMTIPLPVTSGIQAYSALPMLYKHHYDDSTRSPTDSDFSEWSTSSAPSESSFYADTLPNSEIISPFHWNFPPIPTWPGPYNEIELEKIGPSNSFFHAPEENSPTTITLEQTSPDFTSIFDFNPTVVDFPLAFEFSSELDSLLTLPPIEVSTQDSVYLLGECQHELPFGWTYSPELNLSSTSYISTDNSYF